jgi:hypothetical protein
MTHHGYSPHALETALRELWRAAILHIPPSELRPMVERSVVLQELDEFGPDGRDGAGLGRYSYTPANGARR